MITLEERPCPICKTADAVVVHESTYDESRFTVASFSSRKIPEYMHFRLLKCNACGLTYGSPVAAEQSAKEAYRVASFEAHDESAHAARTYASYLAKAGIVSGRALDIGCGDGAFLRELVRLGFTDVVGVEPSESPVRAARDDVRHSIRNEMFDGTQFEPNSFDVVTCFQTLEHVYEPRNLLGDIYRILKPGGTAFLVAHDIDALSAKLLGRKSPIFDIEHVQLFNRHSLEFLLNRIFRDINVISILNSYPLSYWFKLFPLPQAAKMRALQWLEHGALRGIGRTLVPLPAGNMAAFARK